MTIRTLLRSYHASTGPGSALDYVHLGISRVPGAGQRRLELSIEDLALEETHLVQRLLARRVDLPLLGVDLEVLNFLKFTGVSLGVHVIYVI